MDTRPQNKLLKPFNSLMAKVSLGMVSILLVALLVLVLVFVRTAQRDEQQNITNNGDTFARFAATSIYESYSQFYTHPQESDFLIFKTRVSEILSHNVDVTNVKLISLNGRVLFDSEEFKTGKYAGTSFRSVSEDAELLRAVQADTVTTKQIKDGKNDALEIVVPLSEAGGGHVVSMRFVVSYAMLNERMQEVYNRITTVVLALVFFVLIFATGFAYALVRPIHRLTRIAERFRTGDLNVRAEVRSRDELGKLALTLNDMADTIKNYIFSLKSSQTKIEEQYKELRRDEIRLKASINSLNIGFIMTDAAGKIVLMNSMSEEVLSYIITDDGLSKKGTINHDWTTERIDTKLGDGFGFIKMLQQARSTGKPVELNEFVFNGRILRIFLAPIIDADQAGNTQILGCVTVIEDITEAKVLERSKEEFFSIASHELRTPLTAIRGNASLIQTYYTEQMKDESLRELIGDIHGSSIRLIEIVNDFLDVSRAEQGKMSFDLHAFKLDQVIESVVYEISATCKEKGIALSFDHMELGKLKPVYADKNKVKQVIYNLVGNAVKFTGQDDTIDITITPEKKHLRVYIKDSGEGMEPEAQRLLFHKFQQAGKSLYTRNTERGTGLGLYLCKLMLEQMGGTIALESSIKGKGSTFSFTLPIATDAQIKSDPDDAEANSPSALS